MMGEKTRRKDKLSWSRTLVKSWFDVKSKAPEDFQPDDVIFKEERSTKRNLKRAQRGKVGLDSAKVTDSNKCRIFVATWNVAGQSPPSSLNLEDWFQASPPADIYVLGFQEIVPLNAGNVLGTEDNGPAEKWLNLIRKTLNSPPGTIDGNHSPSPLSGPISESDADLEGSVPERESVYFHRHSFQSIKMGHDMLMPRPRLNRHSSVCDRIVFDHRQSDSEPDLKWCSYGDESAFRQLPNTSPIGDSESLLIEESEREPRQSRYILIARKQMVGIFLTIWIKRELKDYVHDVNASCVGRGWMGYLGNKGSISISMSLHRTSFCFVCSHLTSGEKDGDELRRNSDVMEILRKTRFPRIHGLGGENSPKTILEHDQIIWFGDLNYRISLSYRFVKALLEMQNWRALLDCDQLRIERKEGRVFQGWNEGIIHFPPTYKYLHNSDRYAGDEMQPKEKRRTPAWCDRILWYGEGLDQLSYIRGESRFSDHRPVYSIFLAEVEPNYSNVRKKYELFPSQD